MGLEARPQREHGFAYMATVRAGTRCYCDAGDVFLFLRPCARFRSTKYASM